MVATGAQCMGMLAITSLALMLKSPEGQAHSLKEERVGHSAAAENTQPQWAAELAYIPEKG